MALPGTVSRHKLYPSQVYLATKVRRLRRIGSRATPQLGEAFATGKISLRQYDLLSRLGAGQQRARIAALNLEIEASQLAAKTINEILESTKAPGSVRLSEINEAICQAVQAARALSLRNY